MNEDNKRLVVQFLKEDHASDAQIIDMLLLLLNDWQVREAVMHCVRKREQPIQNQKVS